MPGLTHATQADRGEQAVASPAILDAQAGDGPALVARFRGLGRHFLDVRRIKLQHQGVGFQLPGRLARAAAPVKQGTPIGLKGQAHGLGTAGAAHSMAEVEDAGRAGIAPSTGARLSRGSSAVSSWACCSLRQLLPCCVFWKPARALAELSKSRVLVMPLGRAT